MMRTAAANNLDSTDTQIVGLLQKLGKGCKIGRIVRAIKKSEGTIRYRLLTLEALGRKAASTSLSSAPTTTTSGTSGGMAQSGMVGRTSTATSPHHPPPSRGATAALTSSPAAVRATAGTSGMTPTVGPAGMTKAESFFDVFARGGESHCWHLWYQNGWGKWEDVDNR